MITWDKVYFIRKIGRPRGRPSLFGKPMTSAERNRRRMARLTAAETELKALKDKRV